METNINSPKVILFEVEIPGNLGQILRSCACIGAQLYLIQPLGFILHNRYFKRAGMDYIDVQDIKTFPNWEVCRNTFKDYRIIIVSPHGNVHLNNFKTSHNDVLVFGRESVGVPLHMYQDSNIILNIPMVPNCRSLNLGASASMILSRYIY